MSERDPRLRSPDGPFLNIIGPRVKERRKEIKMKQVDMIGRLAVATGGRWTPSRIDITKIEHRLRSCTDNEIIALAAALDCSPAWLLIGDQISKEVIREAVRSWQTASQLALVSLPRTTKPVAVIKAEEPKEDL